MCNTPVFLQGIHEGPGISLSSFEHLLCENSQPDVWPAGRDGEGVAEHLKAQALGQMGP